MAATIKDVAKMAFVSVATVSRVLNNTGYVSEDTKKSINDAITKLDYKPNQFARFLTGKKTGIVGVLVPHMRTSFYGDFIDGLEKAFHSNGYNIMLASTNDSKTLEKNYIEMFKNYNVDGLIIASNILNQQELLNFNKPIVTVDHVLSNDIPSITCDNYSGGRLAAKELIRCNCKNILMLRGPSFLITTQERTNGFIDYLECKEINIDMFDLDLVKPDEDIIYKHLNNNPTIDGIFATSDILAIVALKVLNKLRRKIPDQCRVVGYDNIYFTNLTSPSLSTIEQPISYMGMQACNVFKKLVNNEKLSQIHQVIDVNLIKRDSTNNR